MNKEEVVFDQIVEIYTLENDVMKIKFMNYGGVILHMSLKGSENVVVAYEDMKDYFIDNGPYLNALIGPIAGRIQYGEYELDGKEVKLPINNGLNHLHGGEQGLHTQFFHVEMKENEAHLTLTCKHLGFEGEFVYTIVYKLEGTSFSIDYTCIPSVKQVVNLTNHLYINLDGNIKNGIEAHYLTLPTNKKVEIHKDGYPYKIIDIDKGSAFDFVGGKQIREAYTIGSEEFKITKGIDAPFLLDGGRVELYSDLTKLKLVVESDQESIVIYTANYFDGTKVYEAGYSGFEHAAIALETQAIPNGIHIEGASSSAHDRTHPYHQHTIFTLTKGD